MNIGRMIAVSTFVAGVGAAPLVAYAQGPSGGKEDSGPETIPVSSAHASDTVESAGDEPIALEDIVVTATKRAESIRDIPASINAINGESLEKEGKLNLNEFIRNTPGVTLTQQVPGLARVSIRGIATDIAPTSLTPQAVGFFIGDTAVTDPYIASAIPDLSAFDLAGVQVLKGPQGTLFGGAALSGAIRYELEEPYLGEWQLRGFTQLSEPSKGSAAWTQGIAANAPLGDDLALRIAYIKRNYPGTVDNEITRQSDIEKGGGEQYRAILLWQSDDWKIKLTHLSQDFATGNGIATVDALDHSRSTRTYAGQSPATNSIDLNSLELKYDFDTVQIVSLSSFIKKELLFTLDGSATVTGQPPQGYPPVLVLYTTGDQHGKSFAQEFRIQSKDSGPFSWLAGGYYYDYKIAMDVSIFTPANEAITGPGGLLEQLLGPLGLPLGPVLDNLSIFKGVAGANAQEKALFTDLSYTLWDRLKLSAGARLYETSVKGGTTGSGILIRAESNGMNVDYHADITERGVNPKFSAIFDFSDTISVYAQAAKGFRFGGIQTIPSTATNGIPPTYKSDMLWNYETGLRTTWLDKSLNADLTAFYIDYTNPIILQTAPIVSLAYFDNVSSAISKGLEASLLWNTPLNGLTLSLTGALTDAHITSPFTASGGVEVPAGQQMPGVAPEQYNFTAKYLRPVGSINAAVSAGYNYVGQGYTDIIHSAEINGYGSFDAGVVLSSLTILGKPTLALNVSNICDVVSASSVTVFKPVLGSQFYGYALIPPRTFTARLSFSF